MRKYFLSTVLFCFLLTGLSGCTQESSLVIDLGVYKDELIARQAHLDSEVALEKIGLVRNEKQSVDSNQRPRLETDKFIATSYSDPQSPVGKASETWFVVLMLVKRTKSLQVQLIQLGSREPTEALGTRQREIKSKLEQLLPNETIKAVRK